MSLVKSRLKAARDCLAKKDYLNAKDAASKALEHEPDNYTAHVFLALALMESGDLEESEKVYRRATELNPDQVLAWQGLSKFYELSNKWDRYFDTLTILLKLYSGLQDAQKSADTLQRLLESYRQHGTRMQVANGLSLLLPGSPFFSLLATLPAPDPTHPTSATVTPQAAVHNTLPILEEVISLTEAEEEGVFKREIEKRRTRLGASSPEQLRKEVFKEISTESKLPIFYHEVLNHPNTSDDLRRLTESKLLRYKQRQLHSLPNTADLVGIKAKLVTEINNLVDGVILLQVPDELAWTMFFEKCDCEDISGYGTEVVAQFITLFAKSPMTALFKGYLRYRGVPFITGHEALSDDSEDPLDVIFNAYPAVSHTIFANRIVSDVYLADGDYEKTVKAAKQGLACLDGFQVDTGMHLQRTHMGIQAVLATSLVHLFPPKYFEQASVLIDEVLAFSPENILCLMGRAYIYQAKGEWNDAELLFCRITQLLPDDLDIGLRAREERAWCQCQMNDFDNGLSGLQSVIISLNHIHGRDSDVSRCLWRLGSSHWRLGGDEREAAYKFFIAALKHDPAFAPAFSSLGTYYLECACPSDPIRASKCFQKAFELDPRESMAAKRLAEGFADDGEWELVEVIAKRAIEGEGGLDAGFKEGASGALPKNSWAWAAVGVVELHRQNYPAAIQAFQIALRAEPDDQSLWLRLGESYGKAGRLAAAVKALGRASALDSGDWGCSYLIGDIERRMGHFQNAINIFKSILDSHPSEVGVLFSLSQTHLDLGQMESSSGFPLRSEDSITAAIQIALAMIKGSFGFRSVAWKVITDAAFLLSDSSGFVDEGSVRLLFQDANNLFLDGCSQLAGFMNKRNLQDDLPLSGAAALEVAIFASASRLSIGASDQLSRGSAWYDLGISLYSWTICSRHAADALRIQARAIECLTSALQEDPENEVYWNSFGSAQFLLRPIIAQHAYIKALDINPKRATTWVNLGLLYVHYGDFELATKSLHRGQVLDPDCTLAWLGQALIAKANGDNVSTRALLEHACSLSATLPQADYEFAFHLFQEAKLLTFDALLPAYFLIERYCGRQPDDAAGLHLFALICEGLGHVTFGENLVSRVIAILEVAYEELEETEVENQYIIANLTLGRLRLSLGDYQGAISSFESAMGLLQGENHNSVENLHYQSCLGSGLAHFMANEFQIAISVFQEAQVVTDNILLKGKINVLLAQMMWAAGADDHKAIAKVQLLECISRDPENLSAINTLAGMGILTCDDSLVEAALAEILSLPVEERSKMDPQRDADYLLVQHYLGQNHIRKALAIAQKNVYMVPADVNARQALASLTLQAKQAGSTLGIVGLPSCEVGERSCLLRLQAVAQLTGASSSSKSPVQLAQRAVMLSPSDIDGWKTLAYVQACLQKRR